MKIICNTELATLTFVPVEPDEEQIIASIIGMLQPEDKLSYGGRERDTDDEAFCVITLYAGAGKETRIKAHGNFNVTQEIHVGGIKLVLRGSTEEDKLAVESIRDTCYMGSGGLIYIGEIEVDGQKAIVTTAKRCKHCKAGMIRCHECATGTCNACAEKCKHHYVRGVILGGDGHIGAGEGCNTCGRLKPKVEGEREKSVIEQHLAIERELGVQIRYKGGFPRTPQEVVELNRLTHRYNRSRCRTK